MAVHKILRAGDPVLRQRSVEVTKSEINSAETKQLIDDMFETMQAANGQGLAAPQIAVLKRIVVVRLFRHNPNKTEEDNYIDRVLFNPQIKILESPVLGSWEGCLSVPGFVGYVERNRSIELKFTDIKGKDHTEKVDGYDAVVYQHECDHLDGVLYTDRLADPLLFGYDDVIDTKALKAMVAGRKKAE